MKTLLVGSLIMSAFLVRTAFAGNDKQFLIKAEKDYVKIKCGEMILQTHPGRLNFHLEGPYGYCKSNLSGSVELDDIKIKTTINEMICTLSSKTIRQDINSFIYSLTIIIESNSNAIKVRIKKKNIGEYPGKIDFFYQIMPIRCDYYYDKYGEQLGARERIPVRNYFFLPSNNTKGGYGLILTNREEVELITIYPRADWQTMGWYFRPPRPLPLSKTGEEFDICFSIFPAISVQEVLERYKTSKRN